MYMLIGYIKIFSKAGHPTLAAPAASASASASATSSKVVTVGSGLGRGIRRVFGDYFYSRTGIEIANLMTKYQNREGWTIKDVLTLIHIDPKKMKDDGGRLAIEHVFKTKEEFDPILAAAPPTAEPTKTLLSAIKEIHTIVLRTPAAAPVAATASMTQGELDRIVQLINQVGLCREQLPSQLFKQRKVWEALLMNKGANGKGKGMPLTALIRNLGKLSTDEIKIIEARTMRDQSPAGKQAYSASAASAASAASPQIFQPGHPQHYTEYIFRRITDARDIKRTRIHPYTILVAMLTYKKGSGDKGGMMWTPNIHIVDALDHAFKLAFQNITPTGKRIKIALDVSGSMSSAFCAGSQIVNCATASVAMMMMTLYVERGVASPPQPARDGTTAVAEPVDGGGRNPLWKTTQLPDGRTLYENTKTNECQFTKPLPPQPSAGGGIAPGADTRAKLPPPGAPLYKNTKYYLGIHEPAAPVRPSSSSSSSSYGYSYTPPMTPAYLPELYPPPAIPSNVTICAFANTLTELTNAVVGYMDATTDPATGLPTMSIADALSLVDLPFSSTDCALPMVHALENREQVDAFVIYTDSETFMGKIHPQVALEQYRAATGIDAKLIVVGMTSNCLTIADPKDLNTLNLAGFDTATPRLINDFISGGILPPPPAPAPAAAPPHHHHHHHHTQSTAATTATAEEDDFVILDNE
jgi:hypothetical protein